MVDLVAQRVTALWRGIWSSAPLTLNGWVAFNLPRTVTALGGSLLLGLVAVHVYVFCMEPDLPVYFTIYAAALTISCLITVCALIVGIKPLVPQLGWYFGSLLCLAFLAIYLASRWISLPGLETMTGRWDFAPGTFGMALAAGFIAVHATVLSGINVAYPQRQQWYD